MSCLVKASRIDPADVEDPVPGLAPQENAGNGPPQSRAEGLLLRDSQFPSQPTANAHPTLVLV